jgi:hypothetical protein
LQVRESHSILEFVLFVKALYKDLFKNEPQQVPPSLLADIPPISTLFEKQTPLSLCEQLCTSQLILSKKNTPLS